MLREVCPRCGGSLWLDDGAPWCFNCGAISRARVVYVDFRIRRHPPEAPRAGAEWTPNEEEFVRANHGRLTAAEMAEALGRSERGLWEYFRLNGLKSASRKRRAEPTGELVAHDN